MDLRIFYQQVRKAETQIKEPHVVVVSNETPDGGKAGRTTEVTREVAAKLVVEGRVRLANAEETSQHRNSAVEARRAAEQAAAASRVQFAVISETELKALKGAGKPKA